MLKKFISLVLVFFMICSFAITLTSCGKNKDENGVIYQMNDDKDAYIVIGYKGDDSTVVIPDEFKGYPVIEIGDRAFEGCKDLERISIPDSIMGIGNRAFSLCENLKKVVIPDSVISIGDDAFEYCYDLEYVLIGDSVEVIGDGAFCGCESLTNVIVPVSIKKIGKSAFLINDACFDIYYMGTENDWNKIDIHKNNVNLKNAPIYYYSLTKPLIKGDFWHYINGTTPTIWQ